METVFSQRHLRLSGLARVRHLPAEEQRAQEALNDNPAATTNAVVRLMDWLSNRPDACLLQSIYHFKFQEGGITDLGHSLTQIKFLERFPNPPKFVSKVACSIFTHFSI